MSRRIRACSNDCEKLKAENRVVDLDDEAEEFDDDDEDEDEDEVEDDDGDEVFFFGRCIKRELIRRSREKES